MARSPGGWGNTDAGATKADSVLAFDDRNKGHTFHIDEVAASANVDDYDGLVLTGGGPHSDTLHAEPDAVRFMSKP